MPHFETRRRMAYTPAQMYALVADVVSYPQFLPLCEGLTVTSRAQVGEAQVLIANMQVGYKAIHERFTTRVSLDPAAMLIKAEYIDGPFRHLENRWRFLPVGTDACEVHFFIDYEFKSLMLQMLVGGMFDTAFRRFTDAFEARARAVYGIKRVPIA